MSLKRTASLLVMPGFMPGMTDERSAPNTHRHGQIYSGHPRLRRCKSASVRPLRCGDRLPEALELQVVGYGIGGDIAGRAVDAAAIARRRAAEIKSFHRRARARHQRMRPIDAELVGDVCTDTHGALPHVGIESFDIERREEISP